MPEQQCHSACGLRKHWQQARANPKRLSSGSPTHPPTCSSVHCCSIGRLSKATSQSAHRWRIDLQYGPGCSCIAGVLVTNWQRGGRGSGGWRLLRVCVVASGQPAASTVPKQEVGQEGRQVCGCQSGLLRHAQLGCLPTFSSHLVPDTPLRHPQPLLHHSLPPSCTRRRRSSLGVRRPPAPRHTPPRPNPCSKPPFLPPVLTRRCSLGMRRTASGSRTLHWLITRTCVRLYGVGLGLRWIS